MAGRRLPITTNNYLPTTTQSYLPTHTHTGHRDDVGSRRDRGGSRSIILLCRINVAVAPEPRDSNAVKKSKRTTLSHLSVSIFSALIVMDVACSQSNNFDSLFYILTTISASSLLHHPSFSFSLVLQKNQIFTAICRLRRRHH